MTSPLPLPDWVPWWVHLVIIIAALLFALLFLLMPFSVFGVKARLEGIEARLDEIQGEIRSLSLRLPEPGMGDDPYGPGHQPHGRPPIPPAPHGYTQGYTRPDPSYGRTEPRIVRPQDTDGRRNEPRLY
jgi:hypothetical protein